MGRRDARRIPVGKRKGRHSASQEEIDALLVTLAGAGHRVVRLKAGDPLVFGRAGEEIAALRAAGIAHEIVPGITAALAAAADARASLTLRGSASQLVFVTGHGADGTDACGWESLAAAGATVALYMGRTVASAIRDRLLAAGMGPRTPIVAVEHAGRADRRLFAGTLDDLPELLARAVSAGPVLVLLGPAMAAADIAQAETLATQARRVA